MFRPRSMRQVEILLMRRDLNQALRALAAARVIHLYRIEGEPGEEAAVRAEEESRLARYREFLGRLDRLADELGATEDGGQLLDPIDLEAWEDWATGLLETVDALHQRRQELRRSRLRLVAMTLLLRHVPDIRSTVQDLSRLRLSCLRLGLLPTAALAELASAPVGVRIYPLAVLGNRTLLAALGLRRHEQGLDRSLNKLGFDPIPLWQRLRGEVRQVGPRARRFRARLQRRRLALEDKRRALAAATASLLRDRRYSIEVAMQILERQRAFAYTRRTVAIGGWVPQRRMTELQDLLQRTCQGRYEMREARAVGDETPVLLANPRLLRPFQKLLAVYGVPRYGEIEPTPLLGFGFMLLFGMMFGDLGHGLALVFAGWAVRRWSSWREEGLILVEVGCSAALFGVLFGSFFGWEGLFPPLWFFPLSNIPRLMVAAVAVGVTLMTAGMFLRVVNGLRHEAIAVVLTDRYGVAGIGFYLGSLVLGYLVYQSRLAPAFLLLLLVPLCLVFLHPFTLDHEEGEGSRSLLGAEGLVEVIETVLGFLANTFSFLRVAAFGLAHVGLAIAVFTLADQVLVLPFGVLFAALVHLIGNLVILVLEGLVVSIQTVRLEFYEFFGKFFRGGGVRFTPLALEPFEERRP